jgi:hypothetical protein
MVVKMEFLRISEVGGCGPCNAYDGDEICGEDARWIAAEGERKVPGSEEWEPFRFCVKHWRREVRAQAERDQAESFLRDHGYPDGYGLASLVYIVGSYISAKYKAPDTDEGMNTKLHCREAVGWLKHWIAEQSDLEAVERAVASFERWIQNPNERDPLIEKLLRNSGAPISAQLLMEVRQGFKLGIPIAKKIIRLLAGM